MRKFVKKDVIKINVLLGDADRNFYLLYKLGHHTLLCSSNKVVLRSYKNWKQQPFLV